jgi:hypothetical protein
MTYTSTVGSALLNRRLGLTCVDRHRRCEGKAEEREERENGEDKASGKHGGEGSMDECRVG